MFYIKLVHDNPVRYFSDVIQDKDSFGFLLLFFDICLVGLNFDNTIAKHKWLEVPSKTRLDLVYQYLIRSDLRETLCSDSLCEVGHKYSSFIH